MSALDRLMQVDKSSLFVADGENAPVYVDAGISKIRMMGEKHTAELRAYLAQGEPLINFKNGITLEVAWAEAGEIDEYQSRDVAIRLTDCVLLDRWIENATWTNVFGDMSDMYKPIMVHIVIECIATVSPWVFE
jgi:hypothetical protein